MEFSTIALIVQLVGVMVIFGLFAFLGRSIRRPALTYCAFAWGALSLALAALYVAFRQPAFHAPLLSAYFLGEYAFGFLLGASCRNLASGEVLGLRPSIPWLVGGLFAAALLPHAPGDFNALFVPHSAILAGLFLRAFLALRPARKESPGPGIKVMSTALFVLFVEFLHYVPVFALAVLLDMADRFPHLAYTSALDLLLEASLAFGIVMTILERLREEVEATNRDLTRALDRLALLARTDPLTEALNRHAFGELAGSGGTSPAAFRGSVVLADLNGLKSINDGMGHTAGDAAIRQAAAAIRSVIRADDLLFRWGGDEFLVVLPGLSEEETGKRMEEANAYLASHPVPGGEPGGPPVHVSVSWGTSEFGPAVSLDRAIESADAAMYELKGRRAPSPGGEGSEATRGTAVGVPLSTEVSSGRCVAP